MRLRAYSSGKRAMSRHTEIVGRAVTVGSNCASAACSRLLASQYTLLPAAAMGFDK